MRLEVKACLTRQKRESWQPWLDRMYSTQNRTEVKLWLCTHKENERKRRAFKGFRENIKREIMPVVTSQSGVKRWRIQSEHACNYFDDALLF